MRFFFLFFVLLPQLAQGIIINPFAPRNIIAVWDTTNAPGISNGAGPWNLDSPLFTYNDGVKNSPFCQSCNVAFGGAASAGAAGIVNITGTQRINSLLFGITPGGNYTLTGGTINCSNSNGCPFTINQNGTISSVIGGTNDILKEGGQTLTLSGINTTTGKLKINAGQVNINADMANTAFPIVETADGTTFALNVANPGWLGAAHTISGSGNVVIGAVMVINNLRITTDANSNLTINAGADLENNSGSFPLQNFNGVFNLLGSITSGDTTISCRGITGNGVLNHTTGTVTYNISGPGSYTFTGTSTDMRNTSIFNVSGAVNQTMSGALAGSGSINKQGAGILFLGGANTFTGTLTVTAGTVYSTNQTGFGDGAGAIIMAGGNITSSVGAATTFPKPMTWNVNGIFNFTQPDFGQTWTVTGAWAIANGVTATVSGNKGTGRTNITGLISGAGSLNFTGTTPITVNNNNTYTGGTTIGGGGNVTCGQVNALGTAGVITVNAGGTLNRNGTACGGARIVINNTGVVIN